MPQLLILGYGNPYRSDDGFGFCVAEQFQQECTDPNVRVEAAQELRPEFAELISRADLVVFVDASLNGTPGELQVRELAASGGEMAAFSHDLTPTKLLVSAQFLYGRCPRAIMISVAGESFEFGDTFSPAVRQILPQALAKLREIVR